MPSLSLPNVGLGTVMNDDPDECADTVASALEMGYRHVDTAQVYGNEAAVGTGVRRAAVPREDVTIATKVWRRDIHPGALGAATEESLDRLGVDTVDLLYIHWPPDDTDVGTVFRALARQCDAGRADHVAVSNFTPELLDRAHDNDVTVAANQVELHPLLRQRDLVKYAQTHDHWLVAYSPLARGEIFGVPEIQRVADRHDATPAQISLAWVTSFENVVAIPKATGDSHLRENRHAVKIELTAEDRADIESISREHRVVDPDYAPWS